MEGTQIHIDGQSYTVEGAPFTLEGAQQIQIAEGGQIMTADGQVISQDGITVMNVIDQDQLQEIQSQMGGAAVAAPGSQQTVVVTDESGTVDPNAQQVQYYVV